MNEQSETYLVWSNQRCAFWGPGRRGYVRGLSEAGRYTREEALEICTDAIAGQASQWNMLPELPIRLSDAERVQETYRAKYPRTGPEPWE